MKGVLDLKDNGKWVVRYKMEDDLVATDGGEIPVFPKSLLVVKCRPGLEVSFIMEEVRVIGGTKIFAYLLPKTENMTPRERAKQLVEKMAISISYGTNYTGGDDIPMYKNQYAKQCAMIAIDEIIANIEPSLSMDIIESRIKYWNLIKQEIENL